MTDKLPPNLLALFAPRPPLRYIPPQDYDLTQRSTGKIDGVATFLPALKEEPHPYTPTESWLQKKDRIRQEKIDHVKWLATDGLKLFNPQDDPNIKGDALKTLFVARLRYGVTSDDLRAEFGRFGPIRKIRVVENSNAAENKVKKRQRGYAFIEFEREGDMKAAYKETDGMRIRDRKILVDVERGRTVKDWRPMRLGGGLGGRGYTKQAAMRPMGFGGGYGGPPGGGLRGGFRGGFRGDRRGGYGGGGGGGGGRGGYGGSNSYGGGPPSGPRGPGGYGGRDSGGGGHHGGYGGDRPSYGGRRRYDDGPGGSGGNREPLGHRDDRDRDRKRPYDGGGGYDESRTRRRY